jgi:hypothetical protein
VRDYLDARSFVVRNQRRTTAMLGLIRLHLKGVDNVGRYACCYAHGSTPTAAPHRASASATTRERAAASPPASAYKHRFGAKGDGYSEAQSDLGRNLRPSKSRGSDFTIFCDAHAIRRICTRSDAAPHLAT